MESSALLRKDFYTKVLYMFDLVQNMFIKKVRELVLRGETEIPMNLIVERNKQLKRIIEDCSYYKFDPPLPAELTSSLQQTRLSLSSTGGNLGGNEAQQVVQSPSGKKNKNHRRWHEVIPEDDNSNNWRCAAYDDHFGDHARGKENKATFAKILVNHHRHKDPTDKKKKFQTSPCPKYVCTGTCTNNKCRLSHFAKSKASSIMNGNAKGQAAIEKIDAACTAIFS